MLLLGLPPNVNCLEYSNSVLASSGRLPLNVRASMTWTNADMPKDSQNNGLKGSANQPIQPIQFCSNHGTRGMPPNIVCQMPSVLSKEPMKKPSAPMIFVPLEPGVINCARMWETKDTGIEIISTIHPARI